MKMPQIINLITSQFARHITLVFSGNFLAAGLGFLAVLIISRKLSVSDFGLFNLAMSVMLIASQLSSLGMHTAMTKLASSYFGEEKIQEATQVIRTTFLVTTILSFIFSLIIFKTAELLSTDVFHCSDLTPLLKLAAFGILGISTFNYLKSALYTYQLFRMSVIIQNSVDAGKLSAVLILLYYSKMNVLAALTVFAVAPLIGILLVYGFLWKKLFLKGRHIKKLCNQLFSYGKWVFVHNACGLTLNYVGIFMLTKMLSSEDAGIYGLALNLTHIFPILNKSLGSVLLPKVSRFREMIQFENYIKDSLKLLFVLVILISPFLFFSHKIILLFFGFRYVDSIPVFNLLLLGFIAHTVGITIRMALFSLSKPQVVAIVTASKLIVMVISCYILIPIFGVLAPAISVLFVNVSSLAFLSTYIFWLMKKHKLSYQENK